MVNVPLNDSDYKEDNTIINIAMVNAYDKNLVDKKKFINSMIKNL
jgi:hypothetical protein